MSESSTSIKLKHFGTSGIRGRTLIDITPQLAERMARAYAHVVLSGIIEPTVVIGRDPRFGSETLEMAIISGLTASGVSVIRCDIVPTPVLLTYQRYVKADGAIMITGSHIPPDRIGIIFINADGSYCSDHVSFAIEQAYENSEFNGLIKIESINDLKRIGSIKRAKDVFNVYEDLLYSLVDIEKIKTNNIRLVIDAGNGTASSFVTKFLGKLGLDVIAINDFTNPVGGRLSEPIDNNLEKLKQLILKPSDLGIAFDLDADRVTFVVHSEEESITLNTNDVGAFMINYLLKNNYSGKIILPINTSNVVEEILKPYNLKPIYCKIGQPGTVEAIKKVPNPLFAFEESGKFYFLHHGILWTDGILMLLKILEILASSNQSLYELLHNLPEYHAIADKIQINDDQMRKFQLMLSTTISEISFPLEESRIAIDGHRINFSDSSWLLIRPSGTEPKIRIMADSHSIDRTKNLIEIGKNFVLSLLSKM